MFKTLLLSLTLPLSNAKKILWTGRHHFANTLLYILAVLLLENLPFPCCKDVFCFGCFGVCFQEHVVSLPLFKFHLVLMSCIFKFSRCITQTFFWLHGRDFTWNAKGLDTWSLFLALQAMEANTWHTCHHCPFPHLWQTLVVGLGIIFLLCLDMAPGPISIHGSHCLPPELTHGYHFLVLSR